MSVGVFICDCRYHANNWEDVCQLVYSLVLYISCKQLGGCMSVGVFICDCRYHAKNLGDVRLVRMSVGVFIGIVYIMLTIGGICVGWWMSVGPFGPRVGAFM